MVLTFALSSLVCLIVCGQRLEGCSSSEHWESVLVSKAFGKTHTYLYAREWKCVQRCLNIDKSGFYTVWKFCSHSWSVSLCLCGCLCFCVHPKSGLCAAEWRKQCVPGTSTEEYQLYMRSQVRNAICSTVAISLQLVILGTSYTVSVVYKEGDFWGWSKIWPFQEIFADLSSIMWPICSYSHTHTQRHSNNLAYLWCQAFTYTAAAKAKAAALLILQPLLLQLVIPACHQLHMKFIRD